MPKELVATLWGLLAGFALVIGATIGYYSRVSQGWIAAVMAFGSGVLISALSINLMQEAFKQGGFDSTAVGFIGGSLLFTVGNIFIARRGGKHRKRSNEEQPSEEQAQGSGMAIALGALLDGIPESIVIGMSLITDTSVNFVTVIAIFISNLPEGLSSAAGMRKAGRSAKYVFGLWIGITVVSALASLSGYSVFSHLSSEVVALTTAIAAGAVLTMLVDTMLPEAFEETQFYSGLITVLGFLTAFFLDKLQ